MISDTALCEPSDTAFSEAVGAICWFLDGVISVLQAVVAVAVV
jgi:hypothetical protein